MVVKKKKINPSISKIEKMAEDIIYKVKNEPTPIERLKKGMLLFILVMVNIMIGLKDYKYLKDVYYIIRLDLAFTHFPTNDIIDNLRIIATALSERHVYNVSTFFFVLNKLILKINTLLTTLTATSDKQIKKFTSSMVVSYLNDYIMKKMFRSFYPKPEGVFYKDRKR